MNLNSKETALEIPPALLNSILQKYPKTLRKSTHGFYSLRITTGHLWVKASLRGLIKGSAKIGRFLVNGENPEAGHKWVSIKSGAVTRRFQLA